RLLAEGLAGIRRRAEAHLARLEGNDAATRSKRDFLQGAAIACEAIAGYARRYADEAERLAREAPTPERREELLEIAAICRRVPAGPAHTLHEALQAIWLVDLVLHAVVGARDFSPGRMDQYLYPYYRADLSAGRITPEGALELVQCFFLKCSEVIGLADQANARKRSLCQDSVQYVVLGGQTASGEDAVNPLSFLCLRAGYLKLKQPTIKVRYHPGIDRDFWREACRLLRAGGSVGIYNDLVEIPAFTSVGVALADARNYVHYGCCNANVPGKEGSLLERWHSLPKLLELALNEGVDTLTDERSGAPTPPAETLRTFDDLIEALQAQMRHALEAERAAYPPLTDDDLARCSFTLESIFLEGCIEAGRDWRLGGTAYWHKSQHAVGIGTATDALAAIQTLVYDEGQLSLGALREVLRADFAGHEGLRQRALNRCPKFGNDDPRADAIAARLGELWCDEVLRCNAVPHSVRFWPEIYSYHNNRRLGRQTGATADGRLSGESLSENQSPVYGMDRKGVTACLNSMAKLPFERTPGGGTNLKLHPSAVAGEEGLNALADLIETYFRQGGQHLQFNIVDAAMLRQAQAQPERYRDLSVRVTGYSAYFVTLAPEVQADLIRRTEHWI
ncbi:MAG: hypothetical protein JXA74_07280, partial [Anaerolineae bacterium]|nr:hypothetical protein [Anaerolineae bacterium]